MKLKIQTCDGENGKICSEISFVGVTQESVPVVKAWVQSITGELAVDVLAELFGHCTTDFFPFAYIFLLRRRRMHGVFIGLDFIVTDIHFGVGAW